MKYLKNNMGAFYCDHRKKKICCTGECFMCWHDSPDILTSKRLVGIGYQSDQNTFTWQECKTAHWHANTPLKSLISSATARLLGLIGRKP